MLMLMLMLMIAALGVVRSAVSAWGAGPFRALVLASRRNKLFPKVRESETLSPTPGRGLLPGNGIPATAVAIR